MRHPLRFAAGERVGLAVETQIFEPDSDHILQPLRQCCDDRRGFRLLDAARHFNQLTDFHSGQLGDVVPVDLARQRRLTQPRALAQRALARLEIRHHRFLRSLRQRLDVATYVRAFDLFDDAEVRQVDRSIAEPGFELPVLAVKQTAPSPLW